MHSSNEKKDGQAQEQILADIGLCRWCDIKFSPTAIKSVCHACCKLLMGANLPNEEIFGGQNHYANVFK